MISSIEVLEIDVQLDPHVVVFKVIVGLDEKQAWVETFGSRDQLEAFMRGVQAGACQSQLIPDIKITKYEITPNDEPLEMRT